MSSFYRKPSRNLTALPQIELHRIEDASTSKTTDLPTKILARTKLNRDYVDEVRQCLRRCASLPERKDCWTDLTTDLQSDKEQLFTCAWSVNITTAPYTPVLAVAGRGRAIEIFLVAQRSDGEWLLYHDRSITGHGGVRAFSLLCAARPG